METSLNTQNATPTNTTTNVFNYIETSDHPTLSEHHFLRKVSTDSFYAKFLHNFFQFWQTPTIHFYLHHPKSNKPTPILCYLHLGKATLKFSIGCKAIPMCWDKKNETAIISPLVPDYINFNHQQANYDILTLKTSFSQSLEYICNKFLKLIKNIMENKTHLNCVSDIETRAEMINRTELEMLLNQHTQTILQELQEILITALGGNISIKKQPKKIENDEKLIIYLRQKADKKKESTAKQYNFKINVLETFLKENNIKPLCSNITYKTIYNFARYLEDKNVYDTAKNTLTIIKTLLREISSDPNIIYDYNYKIEEIKIDKSFDTRTIEDKKAKHILASDDQINKLLKMDFSNIKDGNFYRDLFVIQSLAGVRFSDIKNLLSSKNKVVNEGIIVARFLDDKEGKNKKKYKPVQIPISTDKRLLNLYNRYVDDTTIMNLKYDNYRYNLENIAKSSGLFNKVITFNDGKEIVSKYEYELLSTQDGRHTFITDLSNKNLTPDQIATITGHSTTDVLKNHYIHTSEAMLNKQLMGVINKIKAV